MSVHTNPLPAARVDQPPGNAENDDVRSRGRGLAGEFLRMVWADKRRAWGLALLAAVGYGLLAGWWTPRGPMSTFQALAAMGLGLLVGMAAGLVLRTRWAMLVAPAAFAAPSSWPASTSPARPSTASTWTRTLRHHGLRRGPRGPRRFSRSSRWSSARLSGRPGHGAGCPPQRGAAGRCTRVGWAFDAPRPALTALALVLVARRGRRPPRHHRRRSSTRRSQRPRQRRGTDPCRDQRS